MATYYKGKQLSASIVSKYGVSTAQKLAGQTYTVGTLRQGGNGRAPDGGAIVDYPKGWRFLPVPHNSEVGEILKKNPKVVYAMDRLHNLGGVRDDASGTSVGFKKIIDDAHYNLVIAPQIKADEERKAREEEEQSQTIANLKIRVQELTKKPVSEPTAPAVTSSFPIIPIIIIALIVGIFLLRRRA